MRRRPHVQFDSSLAVLVPSLPFQKNLIESIASTGLKG
jgi:hypothetical protein